MGNIFIIIGVLYLLYYAANIIYDLFIRKEKVDHNNDNTEEFSIGDSTVESQNVQIDDVENLNTPSSFNDNNFNVQNEDNVEEEDTEGWRKRFEEEQNMDRFPTQTVNSPPKLKPKDNPINWQNLLNMAETKVQLVSNIDGYKVYKTLS